MRKLLEHSFEGETFGTVGVNVDVIKAAGMLWLKPITALIRVRSLNTVIFLVSNVCSVPSQPVEIRVQ